MNIFSYIQLLRPRHWVKNVFVFSPLFFDGRLLDINSIIITFYVFVAFCFASSGIYCLNDILDVKEDRQHSDKCKRPIASGKVSSSSAIVMMFASFILSFTIILISDSYIVGQVNLMPTIIPLSVYILINSAYCFFLKRIAIIDVIVLSMGFVLRVLAGGVSLEIWLSQWILLMTFLLALFLALAKRRDDVVLFDEEGIITRNSVVGYNKVFIDQAMAIVAAVIIVCYIMWAVSPDVIERFRTSYLYLTTFLILAGILRYIQSTVVGLNSGNPTELLFKDRFMQICIIGWILSFVLIIYVFK